VSRTLSIARPRAREVSTSDVAARATDAAVRAADAAIRAADAAIKAADAAVRLIDEHDGEVIVLQPAPARPRPNLPGSEAQPSRSARVWRALAVTLVALGTLALVDAGVTLLWQEPLSALYTKLRQDHLSGALATIERARPSAVERQALIGLPDQSARVAFLAGQLEHRAGEGSPVGRMDIPRIGVSFVVVKGTSASDLRSGPGIYPGTAFPGIAGTTAIAGHRTTYLAPFRHIDALRRGNRILLNMPYAHFTYTVSATRVVAPTDVNAAVADLGYSRLVLSACTPPFSAAMRLLVYARLTGTVPWGAGRAALASTPPGPGATGLPGGGGEPPPRSHGAAPRAGLPTVLEPVQPYLLFALT
jgi:sortase A